MTRTYTLAAAAFALALAACSPPATDANKDGVADGVRVPTDVSVVAPSTPVGTVSGQVVNSKFAALDGAIVTLVLGGKTDGTGSSFKATVDADGNFAFKSVPAGASGEITATRAGFGTVRVGVTVPAAAGNFPLNDGNANVGMLMLMELNTSLKFTVLTSSGRAAKGARALLEINPTGAQFTAAQGYGTLLGQLSVEGAVDADGFVTFANVPAPAEMARVNNGPGSANAYTLIISDLDEDTGGGVDGRIDYYGAINNYSGLSLFTRPALPIILTDARSTLPLAIAASNAESLVVGGSLAPMRNFVRPSEAVTVLFNQPVIDSTVVVKVTDETCSTNVGATKTMRSDHWGFTLLPAGGSWQAGKKYNIVVRATGLDAANTIGRVGFFFGADPNAPMAVSTTARFEYRKAPGNMLTAQLQFGDDLFVYFDSPITALAGATGGRAFINLDLNANNNIGGAAGDTGEYNTPFTSGFTIGAAEPTFDPTNGTFSCRASGYTTRYRINFSVIPPAGATQVTAGTSLKIILPKDTSSSDGYQTIWGQPASTATSDTFAGTLALGQ